MESSWASIDELMMDWNSDMIQTVPNEKVRSDIPAGAGAVMSFLGDSQENERIEKEDLNESSFRLTLSGHRSS